LRPAIHAATGANYSMGAKQPRQKHVAQRSCVVCRQKTDKRRLTRLVYAPDSGVVVDPTGKRAGRGAYLCRRAACWDKALGSSILNHAFKTKITAVDKEMLAAQRPAQVDNLENAENSRDYDDERKEIHRNT
jgi:uncharacterized protein